jgi:hypothetical protein
MKDAAKAWDILLKSLVAEIRIEGKVVYNLGKLLLGA